MDLFTAFLHFLNIADNSNYLKEAYDKLVDRNEYLGIRIVNFLIISFSLIALLFFVFVLYVLFNDLKD
ncbi:hypothetical protein SAMN05444372_10657 [Flavobacterium micromati]|uniref:Uncharacterized protein n=1 Tax=Flavobacterium micromati TaxID=229205 RepID=A0A1M5JYC3_9FLAO|nr:hypothetical protein [Flavobacterium micromati]SHG45572.1 hypothetical protein SAMN05444372_10657 [Flavobacterium micromati]